MVPGNYVLMHYGLGNATITEQQVAEVRRGGPSSPLLALARGGMAAALIVLLGIAFITFKRRKGVSWHIRGKAQQLHSGTKLL